MSSKVGGEIILHSEGKHDLRAIQFSRRGAFLCILEDAEDRNLYLSISRSPNMWMQRKNLVRITPVLDNKELPYTYEVEPGKMTIHTFAGDVEFCFDGGGRLRVRGGGASLRFSFEMMLFENGCPREIGDWEIAFTILGKLLFVPLRGAMFCNARWAPAKSRADDFIIELLPSVENKTYEIAVHEYISNGLRLPAYESFDACAADAVADFERYCTRFPKVTEAYAATARLGAWVIWMHTLGPHGLLKHEVVYMTRTQWLRAFGWQQSYQAMAASADIRQAWKLLLTMFDYQDAAGQIPDSVGDLGAAYMVTKPALQGFALDYLLKRSDWDLIPAEDNEALYDKLAKFAVWWLEYRDRSHSGLPQYYHADESPGEFSTVFQDGLPMHSGDLIAFVALLTEACARLAGRLGKADKAEEWETLSKQLIHRLVTEFWDGNKFVSRNVKTGKAVDSDSVFCLFPIMLGDRLPAHIIDRLEQRMSDETEYLSAGGITMENMRDRKYTGPFGAAVFHNVLLGIGLQSAGKTSLALEIARRCCDGIVEGGFGFMGMNRKAKAKPDGIVLQPQKKEPGEVNRWSSWTAACFIILANLIKEEQGAGGKEAKGA